MIVINQNQRFSDKQIIKKEVHCMHLSNGLTDVNQLFHFSEG